MFEIKNLFARQLYLALFPIKKNIILKVLHKYIENGV